MKAKTLIFNFICEKSVKGTADKLRGYFASRFGECTLTHHHLNDNKLLYKAPIIQYKMLDGKPFVIGINEGADILQRTHMDINYIKIGHTEYQIKEKAIVLRTDKLGIINDSNTYSFLTPWLALNQKNYEKYQMMATWARRKKLLESILVGNIISMSKSLGYTVPGPIEAHIDKMREVRTSLKGTAMTGFMGTFSVNFEIPDYWGIGKSVSRGFGTVRRCRKTVSVNGVGVGKRCRCRRTVSVTDTDN